MGEKIAEHAVQVRQHLVVPVTNNGDALLRKPLRPVIIGLLLLLGMLSTVHFDRQTTRAIKVDDVPADRILFSKRKAVELIAA
jgi:hypothetical protein